MSMEAVTIFVSDLWYVCLIFHILVSASVYTDNQHCCMGNKVK